MYERITDMKELRKAMREIKHTIKRMEDCFKNRLIYELDSGYFEDLMCLASELYYRMGGE